MGSLIIVFSFTPFKVPYLCLLIIFHQFIIHTNIVVAWKIFRRILQTSFVPVYGLIIIFQPCSVCNSNFIADSGVSGVHISNGLESLYFISTLFLVSSDNKQSILIVRLDCEGFVSPSNRLFLFNSLIFIDKSCIYICWHKIRFELYHFSVGSDSFFIYTLIVK